MTPAVAIAGLTKIVDGRPVVHDVSLDVLPGEIVALSGPDGRAARALVRLLATADRPTAGTLLVGGWDASTHLQAVRRRLAYFPSWVFDRVPLRVDEWLRWLIGTRTGGRAAACAVRARQAILDLGLPADIGVDALSAGQRVSLSIVAASSIPVDVALFDEPATVTADADSGHAAAWQRLRASGAALVFAAETSATAGEPVGFDRVITLEEGRVAGDRRGTASAW